MELRRATVGMLVAVVGVATALSACSTTPVERRDKAAASMDDTKQYVERTKQQVDTTVAAMNDLSGKSGDDLAAQYKQFVREYDKTKSLSQGTEARARNMVAERNDQLNASRDEIAQIQDPQLRQEAESRRTEQKQSLEPLVTNMRDTNVSLQALVKDLDDIKTYLEHNLTPSGVASIKDVMARASGDARSVDQKLAQLGQNLDQASARLRS